MTIEQVNLKIRTLQQYCRRHPNRKEIPAIRREIYDLNAWREDYNNEKKVENKENRLQNKRNYKKQQKYINNRALAEQDIERYTSTDFILNQLEDSTDVELAYHLSQMMKDPGYNGGRTLPKEPSYYTQKKLNVDNWSKSHTIPVKLSKLDKELIK